MNEKMKDLMTHMPHTIGMGVSIEKAQGMMKEYQCHHLPVLDGGKLVGVISDRDIAFATNLDKPNETYVEDVMMDEPVIVSPEDGLKPVLEKMLNQRIHSVIVRADDHETWGIFTTTDLVRLYISKD